MNFNQPIIPENLTQETKNILPDIDRVISEIEKDGVTIKDAVSKINRAIKILTAATLFMTTTPNLSGAHNIEKEAVSKMEAEMHRKGLEELNEIKFIIDLEKQAYSIEEIDDLLKFVEENSVPIQDLKTVFENANEETDKILALKAFSIAYDAVNNNKLSSETKEQFKEFILPNFKTGSFSIVRASKKDLVDGMVGATYDPSTDVYQSSGIDMEDSYQRSAVIHELAHIKQDAQELLQKKGDAEYEAYKIQGEYSMRESGFIREDNDGGIIFSEEIELDSAKPLQQLIVYEYILKNIKNNKSGLNKVNLGGVSLSSNTVEVDQIRLIIDEITEEAKSIICDLQNNTMREAAFKLRSSLLISITQNMDIRKESVMNNGFSRRKK